MLGSQIMLCKGKNIVEIIFLNWNDMEERYKRKCLEKYSKIFLRFFLEKGK